MMTVLSMKKELNQLKAKKYYYFESPMARKLAEYTFKSLRL